MAATAPDRQRSTRRLLRRSLVLILIINTVVVAAGFLGGLHPLIDLCSHFQTQLFFGTILLLLVGIAVRLIKSPAIALILILITGARIAPYWEIGSDPDAVDGEPLRIMFSNVFRKNSDTDRLLKEVRRVDPGVLVLAECSRRWETAIEPLLLEYPFQLSERFPGDSHYGVVILSKHPIRAIEMPIEVRETNFRCAFAEVALPTTSVRLLAVHPFPPIGIRATERRDAQLRIANQMALDTSNGPMVVLGDMNVTPWSSGYRALCAGTSFRNAALGLGLNGTWPTRLPQFMRIPIDHVLVNDEIGVRAFEAGNHIGSDHLPVIVDLTIRQRTP